MKISIALSSLFLLGAVVVASGQDLTIYRDEIYSFSIDYPSTWKAVSPSRPEVRLEVISEHGKGLANFALTVKPVKGGGKATAAQFVKLFLDDRPEMIDAMASALLRNAKVTAKGKTFLGNQEAFYFIFEGQYKTLDETFELKSYMLETLFEGNVYAIAFTTSKGNFERDLQAFRDIASSLGFFRTKL